MTLAEMQALVKQEELNRLHSEMIVQVAHSAPPSEGEDRGAVNRVITVKADHYWPTGRVTVCCGDIVLEGDIATIYFDADGKFHIWHAACFINRVETVKAPWEALMWFQAMVTDFRENNAERRFRLLRAAIVEQGEAFPDVER